LPNTGPKGVGINKIAGFFLTNSHRKRPSFDGLFLYSFPSFPHAGKFLTKLHPDSKKLIKEAIKQIYNFPYSGTDLQGELSGFKSFKPKRYRINYKLSEEKQRIEIYYIVHRTDIYERFKQLLNHFSTE